MKKFKKCLLLFVITSLVLCSCTKSQEEKTLVSLTDVKDKKDLPEGVPVIIQVEDFQKVTENQSYQEKSDGRYSLFWDWAADENYLYFCNYDVNGIVEVFDRKEKNVRHCVISQNVRINIEEIILWKIVMLMRELFLQ